MATVFDETQIFGAAGQPKDDIYTPTADQKYRLGTRYVRGDGRVFHYAQANATTALIAGDVIQSQVDCFVANEQQDNAIPTASAVNDDVIWITTATDTLTEDYCKDGWIIISDGTAAQGGGQIYQIKSHPAGAAGDIKFTLYDKLKVLVSTSAKAGIITNPYKLTVQLPATTGTGFVVGVAPVAVTASYYYWLQTWGMAAVLVKGALTVGEDVIVAYTTAGSCDAQIAGAGSLEHVRIGHCGHTTDTTDWGLVYLQIAP
jgi:hypothetical protein